MAVLLLLVTFFLPIQTMAAEVVGNVDKAVGKTVDSLTEIDQVTGQISLNLTQSEDAHKRGLANFQAADRDNRSKGIFPLPKNHPKYMRVKRLYDRILAVSHYKDSKNLMLEVYESPEFNAYATGGGHIAFFTGLVNESTDAELAYVIGHELAHNAASHTFEQAAHVRLNKKSEIKKGYVESFTNITEQEADRIGILYMTLAGFDPYAGVTAWAKRITGDINQYSYFQTHPPNPERAATNEQTARKVQQYLTLGRQHPNAAELLKCNVVYCNHDHKRLADGKGGGILKLLELAIVTKKTYAEGKVEYDKQRRNMAFVNAPVMRMPLGWEAFQGIVQLGEDSYGISFGLSNQDGVFYYREGRTIQEGTLAYYGTNDEGYWFQWWGFQGHYGMLFLQPYTDGSLHGTTYLSNARGDMVKVGAWSGWKLTREQLDKQQEEIFYEAPPVRWLPGTATYQGTIDLHGYTRGLSIGIAGNHGWFYYRIDGQVMESQMSYYAADPDGGLWYSWVDPYASGLLHFYQNPDGSLQGGVFLDDGSEMGQHVGNWFGLPAN